MKGHLGALMPDFNLMQKTSVVQLICDDDVQKYVESNEAGE